MQKISIIIPVYNTGEYLRKCIDSIVAQTYHNLEIIIVDDGSAKFTADICDELATTDSRIRVFHKKNEGASIARNLGLKKATGDYIGFVDSDDWIDKNMYDVMFSKILETNADIVFCDARTVWDNGKIEEDTFDDIPSVLLGKKELSPGALCLMAGSAWRGLYKSSTIKNVFFPEGLKFSEDRYFNLQAMANAERIYYTKQAFYNRYMRVGSCVNSYHSNGLTTIKEAYCLIEPFIERTWGKSYLPPYYIQKANLYLAMLYGVFMSEKTLLEKYCEIKSIASNSDVKTLLERVTIKDIRFKLIMHQRYVLLFLLLLAHNVINNIKR